MLGQTVVYIDDALAREGYDELESKTLRHLRKTVEPNATILGFATSTEALNYFRNSNNSCDLFICDHNLWWEKQPDESYRFRHSNDFMTYLYTLRPNLRSSPVVIYTDSPEYAYLHWNGDNISFNTVIAKYDKDNDDRRPWEILTEKVNLLLTESRSKEGGYGKAQKER